MSVKNGNAFLKKEQKILAGLQNSYTGLPHLQK